MSNSTLDYVNVGYRRPPPPPPVEEDRPPALPPRNYRHVSTSQLDPPSHGSRAGGYMDPQQRGTPEVQARKPRESSPDRYAQQLRIQYRRFSEQQNLKPTGMSVVSSRPVTHYSQSQKRSSLEPQEATPPSTVSSPVSSSGGMMPPHQMSYTTCHVSPVLQSSPRSSVSSHVSTPVTLPLHVTPPKDNGFPVDSQNNASHTTTASSQNYSPPMSLCSPELPPPPTPVKNPEELAAIHDLDLPDPPPEVIKNMSPAGESAMEGDDR